MIEALTLWEGAQSLLGAIAGGLLVVFVLWLGEGLSRRR